MAREFEILINPGSGVYGDFAVVIDQNRVRREGETIADTPSIATASTPVLIDTQISLQPTWDVPDMTLQGGERAEVVIEFEPDNVTQATDQSMEEMVSDWLDVHGLEVSNLRVEAIAENAFPLRISEYPRSVEHSETFYVGVRTTFSTMLTSAPTATALSLSAGTVNSVCQIIANESYVFDCTAPASGTADIRVTAVASGWSNITANYLFNERIKLS